MYCLEGSLVLLTNNDAFLQATKHVPQYQQLTDVHTNRKRTQNSANKCQVAVMWVDEASSHLGAESTNL